MTSGAVEGPIDNPIPVSPLGPLGERAGFPEPRDDPPSMVESRHDIVEYDLGDWISEQYTELNEAAVDALVLEVDPTFPMS